MSVDFVFEVVWTGILDGIATSVRFLQNFKNDKYLLSKRYRITVNNYFIDPF